mmetsp:Transcript_22412/g.38170  ORF Transcript_22412/g.38170 Transcript_22412/m.38170 type:complete len:136 (+) Transcript_22412:2699-3106(+)
MDPPIAELLIVAQVSCSQDWGHRCPMKAKGARSLHAPPCKLFIRVVLGLHPAIFIADCSACIPAICYVKHEVSLSARLVTQDCYKVLQLLDSDATAPGVAILHVFVGWALICHMGATFQRYPTLASPGKPAAREQ